MPDDARDLWTFSATELAAAYAAGLAPLDVLDATLARIGAVNPALNAIVTLDAIGARQAAEASTRRWASGSPRGPLDGVPITIKDNILVAGLRATWGSKLFEDHVADVDETPVARMREAGAVILGKTNVPEFTVHGYTDNALFGPTGNPWDTALTPGGSSGGAVAAVASGMGALALGTDGGGSIRRPAAHTGLVGFKPSRGMVPRGKGFPAILHDFEVVGPIARCVADVVLAMEVIAGPMWNKPADNPRAPRIAFAPTFDHAPVDPLVRAATEATVAQARACGLDIARIASFDLAAPLDPVWPVISQTGVAWLLAQHPTRRHVVSPAIAAMAEAGDALSARDYLDALDTVSQLKPAFEGFFAQYDFLMTPATAAMPWPAHQSHPATIDGTAVGPRGHAVFTPVANALGLPAIALPCRVDDGTLPVGLQIVAAPGRDRELLDFAAAFESRLFPHRWPPAFV